MDIRGTKKKQYEDWSDDLPENLLKELELAIEETDAGITNTEMIRKYKQKYPDLNLCPKKWDNQPTD